MQKRQAIYKSEKITFGTVNGTTNFTPNPLSFKIGSHRTVKLIEAGITSQIPNLYIDGTIDNLSFGLSFDNGVTWNSCKLTAEKCGIYTIDMINLAIQDIIVNLGVLTTIVENCFEIGYNKSTMKVYVNIDSTKLFVAGQFCVDFGYLTSTLYDVFGFADVVLNTDGLHTATNYAKIDYQGNNVIVKIIGIGNISIVNGEESTQLCSIPMTLISTAGNYYRYPIYGGIQPELSLSCPNQLYSLGFQFVTDTGININVFDGDAYVILEFTEY